MKTCAFLAHQVIAR